MRIKVVGTRAAVEWAKIEPGTVFSINDDDSLYLVFVEHHGMCVAKKLLDLQSFVVHDVDFRDPTLFVEHDSELVVEA